jgi:DNA-binding CsgD family transcriptional regulator
VSFLACRLGRHADVAVAHDTVVDHLGLLERLLPATLLDDYRLAVTVGKPSGSGDRGETAVWGWLCGWALGIASDIAARPPVDPPLALPPADVDPIDDVVAVRVPTKVIAAAATSATPSSTPSRTRLHPHDLTARELEILAAIASGRTNAQIATDFFLSTKTVMHHSVSIYRKLDVRGRAEAVALAYRTGLLAPSGE